MLVDFDLLNYGVERGLHLGPVFVIDREDHYTLFRCLENEVFIFQDVPEGATACGGCYDVNGGNHLREGVDADQRQKEIPMSCLK